MGRQATSFYLPYTLCIRLLCEIAVASFDLLTRVFSQQDEGEMI